LTKGIQVALAGSIINFSIGIFYAWSVFADGLINELGWTTAEAMFPYTLEVLIFSMAMIIGGRFQDRYGPRSGTLFSGIFIGLGFILCGVTASPAGVALSFGGIFAVAAAFGYSAVTPAVIKWFPPAKRGLITGIVLMSLGSGALIWAPVVNYLLAYTGVLNAFIICGVLLLLTITISSRYIEVPASVGDHNIEADNHLSPKNFALVQTIKALPFKLLWTLIGLTSGVGMMFIGHLVQIAAINFQVGWGYLLVSIFAITNASSRLIGGVICDRIGYIGTMYGALILMIASMLLFLSGLGWPALILGTFCLGMSYGSLYTCYPNAVADFFGLDNFGISYGMAITALGVVGSLGPMVSAILVERTATYNYSFLIGIMAALVCFILVTKLKQLVKLNTLP